MKDRTENVYLDGAVGNELRMFQARLKFEHECGDFENPWCSHSVV